LVILVQHFIVMKKLLLTLLISIALLYCKAQIGLGITTPHPNAYFHINSTNKGVLLPRMTALQRLAISPTATANGLMVFDTDSTAYMFWTGTVWKKVGGDDGNWIKNGNNIYNSNSGNVGIGTSAPLARLHVADSAVVFTGSTTEPILLPGLTIPVQNAGTRMLWYPQKAAFRAGYVNGNNWNSNNIGLFSVAVGYNTIAAGDHSFAAGKENYALGISAFVLGENNNANNDYSAALGYANFANGRGAQALGWVNQATGNYSMSIGSNNTASAENSIALGAATTSSGTASLSTGNITTASGNYSFAGGNNSRSTAPYAFSFGNNNQAANNYTFALGEFCRSMNTYGFTAGSNNENNASTAFMFGNNNSNAFGANNSLVIGTSCSAFQPYGVAIGYDAVAAGLHALAIGRNIRANGENSFAIGLSTITNGQNSFAAGSQNTTQGLNSFAMGELNQVFGEASFASGVQNQAWGNNSIALGEGNIVYGKGAFVTGMYNDVNGYYESAISPALTDRIFQLANGNASFARSNALTILRNGRAGFGTTTPSATIHISSTEPQKLILQGFSNDNYGFGVFAGSELRMHGQSGSSIALGNGSVDNFATRFFIDGTSGQYRTGIGTTTPIAPLSFETATGNKISLWGNSTSNHHGLGIQGSLLQMYSSSVSDDIAFGYGSSDNFTEQMRIKGNGNVGIGASDPFYRLDVNGRMRIRSGGNSFSSAGIWLNNYANNVSPAFVGMESDDAVGFYGNTTPNGWGVVMKIGTGNVGIGTSIPSQKLHVMGNILATGTITPSDIRYKKDIQLIESPLQKLSLIRGVNYTMNTKAFPEWKFDSTLQYGLIAQEVEKVFPEMVKPISENGYKGVDYVKLIPVLVEGIKELDSKNAVLEKSNAVLVEENQQVKARLKILEEKVNTLLNGMKTK
jgi:hypothetical protein